MQHTHFLRCMMSRTLSDEFIDGFVQLLKGFDIIMLDCVDDAGRKVLLEDDSADRVDRGFDRGKLDENFRAVSAVFNHPAGRLHMTDDARHTVQHSFCVRSRMDVAVIVRMTAICMYVGMCICMTVLIGMDMFMHMFMSMLMSMSGAV